MEIVTRQELEKHWARVRRFMKTEAMLVVQNADMFYLAGTARDCVFWFPYQGEPTLFLRNGDESVASEPAPVNVIPFRDLSELAAYVRTPESLGVEMDVLPVDIYRTLTG